MVTVLLVDDEKLELEMLLNYVEWERLGFSVIGTAKNGKLGLELADLHQPDLVITDIKMPVMDGIEMSKLLKKSHPEIRIIFLSGYEEFNYAKEALQIGISDYILKPIYLKDFHEFMQKVYDACMEDKKKRDELIKLVEDQFGVFFHAGRFYEDLVLKGEKDFLKQLDIFFKWVESAKTGLSDIKKMTLGIISRVYTADPEFSGALPSPEHIANEMEHLDEIGAVRAVALDYIHTVENFYAAKLSDVNLNTVDKIKAYIGRTFQKQLSIDDIAGAVFLSPGYIRSIFKKYTGATILDYITQVRMEKAKLLLLDKQFKIHDIAQQVGYENVSYFCNVFLKYTGQTPNNYRIKAKV